MKTKYNKLIPNIIITSLTFCFWGINCNGQNANSYKEKFWLLWNELQNIDTARYSKGVFDFSDSISIKYFNTEYMMNDSTQYYVAALHKAKNYTDYARINIGTICTYSRLTEKYFKLLSYKEVEAINTEYAAIINADNYKEGDTAAYNRLLNSIFLTYQNNNTIIPLIMVTYDPANKKINSLFNMLLYCKPEDLEKMNKTLMQ
jgi:hypothetical protein